MSSAVRRITDQILEVKGLSRQCAAIWLVEFKGYTFGRNKTLMFIFLNTSNNSQTLLCVIFKPNLAKDWHQIVIWSLVCISLIFCKIEMNNLLNKKPIWLVWCKFVHILGNNTIIYTLFLNDQLRSLYQLVQTRNFYKIFPKFNLAADANTAHYLSTQSKNQSTPSKTQCHSIYI